MHLKSKHKSKKKKTYPGAEHEPSGMEHYYLHTELPWLIRYKYVFIS
jgi:hypothetical protein